MDMFGLGEFVLLVYLFGDCGILVLFGWDDVCCLISYVCFF